MSNLNSIYKLNKRNPNKRKYLNKRNTRQKKSDLRIDKRKC